ncbi:hypothetical protein ES288_A10G075000v1 [Gossypium darwinii]|uniref:Uncharacterized protein n=1 Tax=Gossypium darwinii TaxID=34276 RepID=A0A5D2EWC2_GOSDA|nr:hypothetical protein ES288_A10G075000v1 [Gossypium darwinii]
MDGFRQGTSRKQLDFFPIPSCMLSHLRRSENSRLQF